MSNVVHFIESILHPLNQCLTHHANLNLLTTIYPRLREAHRLWLCQSHRVGVAQRSNRNQGLRFRCCLRFIHRPSWFLSFEFKPFDITTLCDLIHRFFPPSTGGRNAAQLSESDIITSGYIEASHVHLVWDSGVHCSGSLAEQGV